MNSSNQTSVSVEFVSGKDHYDTVIERVASVKKSLWIGTADIKDLHVKAGNKTKPFLGVLADLLKRGVEIRLIHEKNRVRRSAKISTATQF